MTELALEVPVKVVPGETVWQGQWPLLAIESPVRGSLDTLLYTPDAESLFRAIKSTGSPLRIEQAGPRAIVSRNLGFAPVWFKGKSTTVSGQKIYVAGCFFLGPGMCGWALEFKEDQPWKVSYVGEAGKSR